MSNVRRHEFPNADKPAQERPNNAGSEAAPVAPSWLTQQKGGEEGVRSLMSLLSGESARQDPPPAYQPPPTVAPPPSPVQAAAGPPPTAAASAREATHADSEPSALEMPEDMRLPGPPRLGSLLPGGRSNPPPANDQRNEGLQERYAAFANAALELAIARTATLADLEGQLLDLSIAIAEAVIEREVEADPTLHTALARAALQSLGDTSNVTLRTSHDGYDAITAALGGDEVDVRGVRVHVIADGAVPGLGCIVDGDNVRVDATVNERLLAVRRAFEEERRRVLESVE